MNQQLLAAEIASLMSWDLAETEREVEREVQHPGIHVRGDWERANPQTPAEIEKFYRSSTAYIYDLAVEGTRDIRLQRRLSALEAVEGHHGSLRQVRLLDYGGGAGDDSLYFSKRCLQTAYYDLPGVTSSFAQARFARHKAPVEVIADLSSHGSSFDVVTSLGALRHLANALGHLDEMARLLRPNGLLLVTESFGLVDEDYPSLLSQNADYAGTLPELLEKRGCRLLEVLHDRVYVFTKNAPVTVVVPVYNTFSETVRLLESVRKTDPGYPCTWTFINDGSTDYRVGGLLAQFCAEFPGRAEFIDRAENVGFVRTCNEGFSKTAGADVVLLNSDTVVYDGWVGRLVDAAYSDTAVGTVTPLGNWASIYSVFPDISPDNDINSTLREVNFEPIDIPTGVGFCLYIKRRVIDEVGVFDLAFGKIYGEETDFCQRVALAGYRNVLARNCFVYHVGQASTVPAGIIPAGQISIPKHEALINARYPYYAGAVSDFVASGLMGHLDSYVSKRYVQRISKTRSSVALVVHNNPYSEVIGGTESHVRDLINALREHYVVYVVFPDGPAVRVVADVDGVRSEVEWRHLTYGGLLEELRPSVVHVHHLMGFSPVFVEALCRWPGPKLFTIHDYFSVCPQYMLLDYQEMFCGVPELQRCRECAEHLFDTGLEAPLRQRVLHQKLIDSADVVIAPSAAALEVVRKALEVPDDKVRVIPHPYRAPRPAVGRETSGERVVKDGRLVVGFLGYDAPHKGGALVPEIVSGLPASQVRFVMIGSIGQGARGRDNVTWNGAYRREDIVDVITRHALDAIVLPSLWPETFSFTLTEAWAAGVPVVVGPVGALAERVAANGGGLIVPELTAQAFTAALRRLHADRELLSRLAQEAARRPPETRFDEYITLYKNMIRTPPEETCLFSGGLIGGPRPEVDWITIAPPNVRAMWRFRHWLFPSASLRERLYIWLRDRLSA